MRLDFPKARMAKSTRAARIIEALVICFIEIGLSMAICGYLWLSMAIYGYLWLSMAIYGYLWLSMAIYGYLVTPVAFHEKKKDVDLSQNKN